jgi:Ca2+/Na+ antiporter
MIKNWLRDLALTVQSRSGVTAGLVIWVFVAAFALSTALVFLCVAAYAWLSQAFGGIYAGLIVAGFFILVTLIASIAAAVTRRRARERAILQRAARAQASSSWLLDPKILATAMQAGRAIGWQRIVPLALLGFLAAQWVRDRGQAPADEADPSS